MALLEAMGIVDLNDMLGLHFFLASDFSIYQLVTYMFMHGSFEHLFFNMFALWMFGCVVENVWGPRKFLIYYIACGVGAGVMQELAQLGQFYLMCRDLNFGFSFADMIRIAHNSVHVLNAWTTVGASGSVYAILLAFGMIFPEQRIFIFPLPIPIKAKWLVIGYAAIELFSAMAQTGDNVAHIAHLGGMIFGLFMIRYWRKHPTEGFGMQNGQSLFQRMQENWERRSGKSATQHKANYGPAMRDRGDDWQYNAEQKAKQEEIDRILDKIRKSGYESLTLKEKQTLFELSNRNKTQQ